MGPFQFEIWFTEVHGGRERDRGHKLKQQGWDQIQEKALQFEGQQTFEQVAKIQTIVQQFSLFSITCVCKFLYLLLNKCMCSTCIIEIPMHTLHYIYTYKMQIFIYVWYDRSTLERAELMLNCFWGFDIDETRNGYEWYTCFHGLKIVTLMIAFDYVDIYYLKMLILSGDFLI